MLRHRKLSRASSSGTISPVASELCSSTASISSGRRSGLVLHCHSTTWKGDSHGLFDYESANVLSKDLKATCLRDVYYIFRLSGDVVLYTEDEAATALASEKPCRLLARLLWNNGAYELAPVTASCVESMRCRRSAPNAPRRTPLTGGKLWLVVRKLHEAGGVALGVGDIVKLGRYRLKVRQIAVSSEDAVSPHNFVNILFGSSRSSGPESSLDDEGDEADDCDDAAAERAAVAPPSAGDLAAAPNQRPAYESGLLLTRPRAEATRSGSDWWVDTDYYGGVASSEQSGPLPECVFREGNQSCGSGISMAQTQATRAENVGPSAGESPPAPQECPEWRGSGETDGPHRSSPPVAPTHYGSGRSALASCGALTLRSAPSSQFIAAGHDEFACGTNAGSHGTSPSWNADVSSAELGQQTRETDSGCSAVPNDRMLLPVQGGTVNGGSENNCKSSPICRICLCGRDDLDPPNADAPQTTHIVDDGSPLGSQLPVARQRNKQTISRHQPSFNPLVSPCECRGSMKWVHLSCLRTWIAGRLNINEDSPALAFYWRPLKCELCKVPYPVAMKVSLATGEVSAPANSPRLLLLPQLPTQAPLLEASPSADYSLAPGIKLEPPKTTAADIGNGLSLSHRGDRLRHEACHGSERSSCSHFTRVSSACFPDSDDCGTSRRSRDLAVDETALPTSLEHKSSDTVSVYSATTSAETTIQLFDLPTPHLPYVILEPKSADNRGLHVVSLSHSRAIKLGRGHESDVRLGGISVSRLHAVLRYEPVPKTGPGRPIGARRVPLVLTESGLIETATAPGVCVIEDNRSKFGTLLEIRRPLRLQPGLPPISVQIGRSVLTFSFRRKWRLLLPTCLRQPSLDVLAATHFRQQVQQEQHEQPQP